MKKLIFILVTFLTIPSFSQDKKELNPDEFQKLKISYAEMTNSESYKAMITQSKLIASMMNGLQLGDVNTEEGFDKWITENISKAKFPNINEANLMYKKMLQLSSKVLIEHKSVFMQFQKTSQSQSLEIVLDEQSRE